MLQAGSLISGALQARDNKRPTILDAAALTFADQGYAAASMREIATAAGMKAGSIYYYFASKEDLLVAVHEEGIRRISFAVDQALKRKVDPWERLEAAMACHLKVLLGGGAYARVVITVPCGENSFLSPTLIKFRDGYERIFVELVAELGLSPGLAERHVRLMILGAMNWTPTWYRAGGEKPQEIATSFVQALRYGPAK